ncbi:MAG: hypothetical protein R2862_06495 [Thermoanaerobaculia bacterium]
MIDSSGEPNLMVQPFPPNEAEMAGGAGRDDPALVRRRLRAVLRPRRRAVLGAGVDGGTFSAGTPRRLGPLSHSIVPTTDTATAYDISPGGRFLAVKSDTDANAGKHLIVGLRWTDRLPQLLSGAR